MIRKERVRKELISSIDLEIKYAIHGLECLEPFVYSHWDRHIIYFTESLYIPYGIPMGYICVDRQSLAALFVGMGANCVGSFYDSISPEEKELFKTNLIEINKLLKIY